MRGRICWEVLGSVFWGVARVSACFPEVSWSCCLYSLSVVSILLSQVPSSGDVMCVHWLFVSATMARPFPSTVFITCFFRSGLVYFWWDYLGYSVGLFGVLATRLTSLAGLLAPFSGFLFLVQPLGWPVVPVCFRVFGWVAGFGFRLVSVPGADLGFLC